MINLCSQVYDNAFQFYRFSVCRNGSSCNRLWFRPCCHGFFAFFMPYEKAIAINIFEFIWATLFLAFKNRKYIPWKVLFPLLIPSVVIAGISAYLSLSVDSSVMFLLRGFVLVILAYGGLLCCHGYRFCLGKGNLQKDQR